MLAVLSAPTLGIGLRPRVEPGSSSVKNAQAVDLGNLNRRSVEIEFAGYRSCKRGISLQI